MAQKYGQHFLIDTSVLEQIFHEVQDFCKYKKEIKNLIEIGPGQGALTKHLKALEKQMYCYEVDTSLEIKLQKYIKKGVQVIWGDVLQQDISHYNQDTTLVVGNLPYYITSPIFRKFFEENAFLGGVFLIQKEVATKIMTDARKKSYLWWLLNNHFHINYCFTVAASAFSPPPKVESAVVRFTRKDRILSEDIYIKLLGILDILSPYKRKTLGKIGKMTSIYIPEHIGHKRLEELNRDEMLEIIGI